LKYVQIFVGAFLEREFDDTTSSPTSTFYYRKSKVAVSRYLVSQWH